MHPSSSSCSSGAPYLSIPNHPHPQHAASYPSDAACAYYVAHGSKESSDAGAYATQTASRSHEDFKSYVARIIWEADNDSEAFPLDAYHIWSLEGSGSPAGSLSSLGSSAHAPAEEEEDGEGAFVYDRLSLWGPKFQTLSEMYDRPQLALTYREAVAYVQGRHSLEPLPYHH